MVSGLAQQALSPEWNVPPVDQPPPDWSEGKIRWPRLAGQGDSSIMTQGGSSSQEEVGVTQALIRLPHGLWGQRNLTDLSHQLGEGSVSLLEKSFRVLVPHCHRRRRLEQLRQRDGAVQGFVGIWEAPGTGGFSHLQSQLILQR